MNGLNKFGAKKTEIDGILFDSKHEAMRYCELKYLARIGAITDLKTQVAFELIPSQKGPDGKVTERAVRYIADFTYNDEHGNFVVEDAKSPATRTDVYKIKRKLMLERFGVRIQEV